MKVPKKIKSGTKLNENRPMSIIFYITLLSLDGIIKRTGVKDANLYKTHNVDEIFDFELISSGIAFNLYSEYGLGNVLLPVIIDFFDNLELDPEKYKDNIFYKEILKIVPEITGIVREADPKKESEWAYKYGLVGVKDKDSDLEKERQNRLKPLLNKKVKSERCHCDFCIEFRKYHIIREKHIDYYIIDLLIDISKNKDHYSS